jgi:hypothetical protein
MEATALATTGSRTVAPPRILIVDDDVELAEKGSTARCYIGQRAVQGRLGRAPGVMS